MVLPKLRGLSRYGTVLVLGMYCRHGRIDQSSYMILGHRLAPPARQMALACVIAAGPFALRLHVLGASIASCR